MELHSSHKISLSLSLWELLPARMFGHLPRPSSRYPRPLSSSIKSPNSSSSTVSEIGFSILIWNRSKLRSGFFRRPRTMATHPRSHQLPTPNLNSVELLPSLTELDLTATRLSSLDTSTATLTNLSLLQNLFEEAAVEPISAWIALSGLKVLLPPI
ncbi:hypothetical protein ACLB2K_001642 [Fragaria x ananassa]